MPFKSTDKTVLEIQRGDWGITIAQGYINKEGDFKVEFCKKKNFETKELSDVRPLSVYVGKTEERAIALANYILDAFGQGDGGQHGGGEDVPF